jgi:predicted dehydrogenase
MVGVGGFGGYRRERMRESGVFNQAAVTDRNAETLAKAAQQEGAQPFGSFEEMLKAPGLEGIVISTGADSHAPLSLAAMRAGKHVFVEKPLCPMASEVSELRRTTRETGRIYGVGHNHEPSDPIHQLTRNFIDEGRLGTVACYEKNTSHSGGLEIKPGDWRGLADRNPGGMLFQCGVHALHTLQELFGPVVAVQAMMRYDANPNTQTADVANVLLRHESGLVGTLNCYHVTAYFHELRIFGTKGSLYFDTHHRTATFQQRKRNEVEHKESIPVPAHNSTQLCANLTAWHRAIREGGEPNPSLEQGIRAVLPIFAAERAAKEKREVTIAEIEQDVKARN